MSWTRINCLWNAALKAIAPFDALIPSVPALCFQLRPRLSDARDSSTQTRIR